MDTQLTYARKLQAAGYTLAQIRDLLLQNGVDRRTVYVILGSIQNVRPDITPTAQATTYQKNPTHPETVSIDLSAYTEYVKDLRARGVPWTSIDPYLASQGLSVSDRSKIYAAVHTAEPKPSPAQPSNPAPFVLSQGPIAATPSLTESAQPHIKTSPQSVSNAQVEETAEEKFIDATQRLGQAVDHLSNVVDKLDNELHNAALSPSDTTKRLSTTVSNLSDSTKNLADNITHVPPSPPSAPNAVAVSQPIFVEPVHQQIRLPNTSAPSIATTKLDMTTGIPIRSVAQFNIPLIVVSVAIFVAIFIYSLLSHERNSIWLGLISMNVVGTASFDLLLRGSTWQRVDRWLTATILQTGLFLPFLAKEIARPIHFSHYTPFDFLLLGCATTMLITMQFCNVKALQYLEASVFSVFYNTRILFATLLGFIFLSESVGLLSLIGGLLIFVAIFIVRQRSAKGITKQGVLFGLATALAMSSMNTCEKELIKLVGYEQYIFPMFGIAAVIMWSIVLLRHTETPFKLLLQPRGIVLMALRACAGIGFSYSLVFGPVAVSSYVSSLSVVLIVVFGILFLGERDYLKAKLGAVVTAVIGLTFILLDNI